MTKPNVKKNDRVIVKAAKNEWYTGTVTRSGATSIAIKFDDTMVAVVDEEDFKDVKPMLIEYRSTEPLTDEEAKKLYIKQRSLKSTPIKISLKQDEPVLSAMDKRLVEYGRPDLFDDAKSRSTRAALRWVETQYNTFNRDLFQDKLPRPVFTIMSVTDEKKVRTNGLWKAKLRHLCIGMSVFEGDELRATKVLLHVMCHQAVSEIDKRVGGGHDEFWGRWTVKALIPAYTQEGIVNDVPVMHRFEPQTAAELPPILKTLSKIDTMKADLDQFKEPPYNDTPAMMLASSGVWRKGLLLGQYRREGNVHLLMVPSLDKVKEVPLSSLNVMPEDQHHLFKSPEWKASANRVRRDLGIKPRIHNINGQVRCSVCGETIRTPQQIAVQIDEKIFDAEHAAEYLGMDAAVLTKLVKTRQV